MPHIPGFPGGALGSNAPQQPPATIPPNFHPFTPQQQQAFLAQHQLHQQRQFQSSPPQPQVVQGVPDPEHQRMWQAMDQHVRAHNDATQSNPTFTQMADYLRAGGVPHQQLAQQTRIGLPGFSQQIPSQNPPMNPSPNPNPNPIHHGLAPNSGAPPFPAGTLSQLTAAQLQGLAERDPPMRAAIQQHQQRQQAQAQAQQQATQQQQQQHGVIANPFDNFGLNLTANTQHIQHPVTPANAAATVNVNQADLNRQLQFMSRAGQNQGQNGSTLNQASPVPHPNRSQQPLSQSIQNGGQIPAGTIPMGAHVIPQQTHPGAGQAVINRSMFAGSSAQFAPVTNPNLMGTGHPQPAPQQQNPVNPQQRAMMNFRNFDKSKIDQQLALLHTQLANGESQLRSMGFNPSMMPAQLTDDQRGLLAEMQNKKTMYTKLAQIRHQLERFQSSTQGLQGTSPAAGDVGMMSNGNIAPSNATVSQAQAQQALVHTWLQHSAGSAGVGAGVQHAQKADAPPPPALVARPPSQARMESLFSQPQLSQYQLQQQQQQQPAQRSASVQPQPASAQIVRRQQQQGMQPLVNPQQQQQQSLPFSVGQAPPPSVALPQQQQMRATFVETLQLPERATFDAQLKTVLVKQKLTIDSAVLLVEGKEINLYDLEMEVLKRGGGSNVSQHSLWPVIGASLGWVAYPANGTEPAKSAPQVAQRLMTLHRTYLLTWESLFIQRVLQERRRRAVAANAPQLPPSLVGISQPQQQPPPPPPTQQQQQSQQPQQLPPPQPQQQPQAQTQPQPPQPPQTQPQPQHQLVQRQQPPNGYPFSQNHQNQIPVQQTGQSPEAPRPPQQPQPHLGFRPALSLSAYIQFVHMSAEDMRKHGIPEQSIAFIENNREGLLRRWELYQQQSRAVGLPQPPTMPPQQPVPQQPQVGAQPPSSFPVPPEVARALQAGVPGSVPNAVPQPQGQGMAPRSAVPPTRPSQAQVSAAMTFVRMTEMEYTSKRRSFQPVVVAEHEKSAYMQRFDQLWRAVQDMEKNLTMFHALFEDEQATQKLVAIIFTTREQRRLLTSPAAPPHYILNYQVVQSLLAELSNTMERFHKAYSQIARNLHVAQLQPSAAIPPVSATVTGPVPAPAPTSMVVGPPPHPTPQSQPPARSIAPPPPQPVVKPNNKKAPATGGVSTPSPAPAHTPAAAAQTPPATSPRTPKSPAKKPVAKNKPAQKRRVSKASQRPPTPVPAAAPATLPVEPRSTEKQTTPKRPREEEPESQGVAAPQATGEPSPKRVKLAEWDGPPSEELNKRRQEVEGVKTEQDVQTFLTRATEDLLSSGNDDGPADGGVPNAFRTLQELFKGTPLFDLPDVFNLSSSSDPVLGGAPASSSPKMVDSMLDSFEDFFDFSQCAPDEPAPASSKLDTPELVHGSSANPSPESVAETPKGDHAAIASNKAKDVANLQETISSHPLALGGWEEINGGEPAFYEHPGFKWEGDMPVLESPWAISSAGA